jgi:endonuclease VIII
MVWRTARQLDAALSGRVLTRSDFRVPRFALTDLSGRLVTETVSRGKHILTRVADAKITSVKDTGTGNDGGLTVHTHLRMDGSWRVRQAAERVGSDHRIRLVLANDEWQAIGYLLGEVDVLPTAAEDRVTGHLGPDLLGPDWDAAEAVRRLASQPDRPIGEALLDQRNLAGIGNLYKAEMLFLRGIDPWRPAGQIAGLAPLVELGRRLLEANKERPGQVTTGVARPGQQNWVYGRAGRPCRRCGTPILSAVQGSGDDGPANLRRPARDRITYWCPHCQPAAAAPDAGRPR